MEAAETAMGTTFMGAPFATDLTGSAVIERDIELVDFSLGYALNERFLVSLSAKDMSLEQQGDLVFGADLGASTWRIDTTGLEARLDVALTPTLVLGAGFSTEERDVDRRQTLVPDLSGHAQTTQRDGFFVSLSFDPIGPLSLMASVEDDSIDDPFTLSAPSQGQRIRVQGRYRWDNGVALNASYRQNDLENDLSGWTGDTEQTDLRLSYAGETLSVSAGYGQVEYARRIDQAVSGGSRVDVFAIAYGADADFVDASLRWQLGAKVATGAYARRYENAGSYALERDDWRAFVEVALRGNYLLQLAKRSIDYDEDGFDDYNAELVELALGYRW